MSKSHSRKASYFLAGCLFFILFLLTAGMFLVPELRIQIEKTQQIIALQNRGVITNSCVTDKDAHEDFRGLPEVIYSFQTNDNAFEGRMRVSEQAFEQIQFGNCFNIVYLPEDPTINSSQTYVESFDLREYWSDYLVPIPAILGVLAFMILLAIFSYVFRRWYYK